MSHFKVLLVDDDIKLLALMKKTLSQTFEVSTAASGQTALSIAKQQDFDAAVLDIDMPVMNGFKLLARLKKVQPHCCYMFLTSFTDDSTYIRSLDLDPDDFLIKPITALRLQATIQYRLQKQLSKTRYGALTLNNDKDYIESVSGKIHLTRKEQQILWTLMKSAEHKMARQELVQSLWEDVSVSPHTLDTHIVNLRRKLSPTGVQIRVDNNHNFYLSVTSSCES